MDNSRVALSLKQLIALRECKSKYELMKIKLNLADFPKLNITEKGLNTIFSLLEKKGCMDTGVQSFVKDYIDPSWYEFDASYDAQVERTSTLLFRMGSYLQDYIGKFECRFISQVSFDLDFVLNETKIEQIYLKNLICVQRDGYVEVILLQSGKPQASSRARKIENFPENSIPVSVAYAAARQECPELDIKVSLFHLVNKDDKGTTYQSYEHKVEKNIVSSTFTSDVDAIEHLKHVIGYSCSKECDDCLQKSCCMFSTCFSKQESEQETHVASNREFEPTDSQKKVIYHVDGPMLVEAVPGSGKTASLVKRQSYLSSCGISASNMLMITFSRKACAEIIGRLSKELANDNLPVVETFNSFGYKILRENPSILGELKLADDTDKKDKILQALKDCYSENIKIQNVNYSYVDGDYGLINNLFNYFDRIDRYGKDTFVLQYQEKKDVDGILNIYDKYKSILESEGFISYDQQISLVIKLFKEHKDILLNYQEIYKYIMVDEYQDVNAEQFELLQLLAERYKNIVAVGDCDQGIYSFRGGDSYYALHFKDYYPDAEIVYMEDNFRCTDGIIRAANALIANNKQRYDKKIMGHKKDGSVPFVYSSLPTGGEGVLVNNLLKKYKPGEIAVISSFNKSLEKFGRKVCSDGSLKPKDPLIYDSVFLSFRDLIELKVNGFDNDTVLYRALIIAGARREDFIGIKQSHAVSLYKALIEHNYIPELIPMSLKESSENRLWNAGKRVREALLSFSYNHGIKNMLSGICQALFGVSEHPVINVLVELCDERLITQSSQLLKQLNAMIRFQSTLRVGYGESEERINLLTAHDSKGKEFPCVIIYGIDEFEPDEERRRLLYVALTRAKETLVIIQNMTTENMLSEFKHCCRHLVMKGERANG